MTPLRDRIHGQNGSFPLRFNDLRFDMLGIMRSRNEGIRELEK